MSLLHALDEMVKMSLDEEARLSESILQCREMLRSMYQSPEPALPGKTQEETTTEDILPEERQDIQLLEKVLKKALKVRSASEAHQARTLHVKKSRSASAEEQKAKLRPDERAETGISGAGTVSLVQKQKQMFVKRTSSSQHKPSARTEVPPAEQNVSAPPHGHTAGAPASREKAVPSPLFSLWQAQKKTQIRLWKKLLHQHSKPVAEKSQFSRRLRATFPSDWPSRSPAEALAELDSLAEQCVELTHGLRLMDGEQGRRHDEAYETAADLLTRADRQRKDWETWERRLSGPVCGIRWRCSGPVLPPVLSYASEAELRELKTLTLRVEQLQQLVRLQQVMMEVLAGSWGRDPSAPALRGLYTLLVEGGLRFPALILDQH